MRVDLQFSHTSFTCVSFASDEPALAVVGTIRPPHFSQIRIAISSAPFETDKPCGKIRALPHPLFGFQENNFPDAKE
jgi:hypothetical protein